MRHPSHFLLACVLCLPLYFLGSHRASAQITCSPCPQPGWISATATAVIPNPCPGQSGTVTVKYCYCYPDPNGAVFPKTQLIVNEIVIYPTLPCALDGPIMRTLKEELIRLNPTNTDICATTPNCSQWCMNHPNCHCPSAYPQWTVKSAGCVKEQYYSEWDEENDVEINVGISYHSCGTAYCTSVFEVCCDNGSPQPRWLASSFENDCGTDPGCYVVCESMQNPTISCCDANGNPVPHCPDGNCPSHVTGCPP